MKKTATRAGSGQGAKSDPIVPATSQAVLDLECHSGWTGVPAEAAYQSQHTASDPSVSVAAGSDETAQEPVTLLHQQVRDKAWGVKVWKDQLRRLEPLDLPLLGCGADKPGERGKRKAPANLRNGSLLGGWPTAKHTVGGICNACSKVICAGTRTGKDAHGLIAFDLDGETAVSWCLERGCDPLLTPTWQVHRNTDESRLKVLFRLTWEQQQQLGQLKTKTDTKAAIKDAKGKTIENGEAVELFHGVAQVIIVGQHNQSKGYYFWPDGMGPEALASIPECWWEAALEIAQGTPATASKPARKASTGKWRNLSPCPICGRPDGWCQQSTDANPTIRCMHGESYSPPSGLKRGELHTDQEGTVWAFSKVDKQKDGETYSAFTTPDPNKLSAGVSTPRQQQQRQPKLAPVTSTGIQAVLDARGSVWQAQKEEPPIRSKIEIGDLSGRLHKVLGERLGFDELALRPAVDGVPLKDWQVKLLHAYLSERGWCIGTEAAIDGLLLAAHQNPFHPVRQYLERVADDPAVEPFDLDQVAPRFFREKGKLHTAMVRKWLIGAVARAMDPGCQMDYCLVLQSDTQGIGKSTTFRELASPDWFCSTIPEGDKDLSLNIHNTWIFELAELETLTGRKAAGHLKNMLTTTTDLVRVPYGKASERLKRPSVFCATVNKRVFLRDETGNRRFWVVPIDGTDKIDRAELAAARDGIWKAAVQAWRSGELPMLPAGLADASEQQNDNYQEQDTWLPVLAQYLSRRLQEEQTPVQVGEFLDHLGMTKDRQNPRDAGRAREVAQSLGWRHRQGTTTDKKRIKGLWPPTATQATQTATQSYPSAANGSRSTATQTTQKSQDQSMRSEKQDQGEGNAQSEVFRVASVAMASNPSAANGSASVAVGLQCNPTARADRPLHPPWVVVGTSGDLSETTVKQDSFLRLTRQQHLRHWFLAGGVRGQMALGRVLSSQ